MLNINIDAEPLPIHYICQSQDMVALRTRVVCKYLYILSFFRSGSSRTIPTAFSLRSRLSILLASVLPCCPPHFQDARVQPQSKHQIKAWPNPSHCKEVARLFEKFTAKYQHYWPIRREQKIAQCQLLQGISNQLNKGAEIMDDSESREMDVEQDLDTDESGNGG